MRYEVRRTYDMEALSMKAREEMNKAVVKALADREEEYEEAIETLFADRIASREEIDEVAKKFNIPYDYVEFEGWAYVED
jgi:hypothetical protein